MLDIAEYTCPVKLSFLLNTSWWHEDKYSALVGQDVLPCFAMFLSCVSQLYVAISSNPIWLIRPRNPTLSVQIFLYK